MMKSLKNNLNLKLLSFLFAFLLWLIVVNIDNPVTTETFHDIPVIVENSEVLTEQQKTYQIVDNTQSVSVSVSAERRSLAKIKSEDIVVTADIKEMYLDSQIPLKVIISGFEGSYKAEANPHNLQIQIEENISKTLYITPVSTGKVRNGYVLGNLKTIPETVTINGPESLVNQISKAAAEVDIAGLSENTELEADLVFYDSNNKVIDQSRLANNLGNFGVNVAVTLYKTKNVSIQVDTSGIEVGEGYSISAIKIAPEEISVAGADEALAQIESIQIPAKEFEGDVITRKTEYTIDLTEYLPEGIQLTDAMANTMVVTVSLEKDGTRNFQLPIGSITVKNLNGKLRMSYSTTEDLEVHVKGTGELLDKVDIGQAAFINLETYEKAGVYTIPVELKLPDGCSLEEKVWVEVVLEEKENGG